MIWNAKDPSKVPLFVWSLAQVNYAIQRWNPNVCLSPSWCVMCKRSGESADHLFLHCHKALHCFRQLEFLEWFQLLAFLSFQRLLMLLGKVKKLVLWICSVLATFWVIWLDRNWRLFLRFWGRHHLFMGKSGIRSFSLGVITKEFQDSSFI